MERAADQILKTQGKGAVSDFDSRLRARVDSKGAGNQLSSQTLQLEKLQKRLVEVEIDGVDVSKNKAAVEKLIADIKSGQIPVSKLSVDLVAKELKDARSRLGISQSQAKIDGKIADVLKGAVGGPSKKIDDLAAQQKYATAINDTYRQTEDILTKISEASISTTRKLALAGNVEQARYELYENRLENAQGITKEVERQLKLETAMQKGAGSGRKASAADTLKEEGEARRVLSNQLAALEDVQTRYAIEEKKGVQLSSEKVELGKLINRIKNDEVALTKESTKAVGESIRLFNSFGRYAKNRAIDEGTYAGGSKAGGTKSGATTAEQLEDRRSKLLNVAAGGLSRLIDLENKGVAVSDEKLKVEQAIKDIQLLRGKATQKELVALAQEVAAAKELASIKAVNLKAGAIPGAGLQAALQSLQEARNSRQQFLGTMSPAEGIDKIVREFNTGKAGGAAGGAAGVADSVTESFTTGLKTGIPQAVAAAIAFSQAVIEAFRNKFKARSPAKAIIDEVIIPIVQAFEKLRDFTGRGVSAGKSFASSVMDSITGKVPDVVNKTRTLIKDSRARLGAPESLAGLGGRPESPGFGRPSSPGLSFGLDPNVALRLGGGRVTGGYPPVSGIFAPGSTPPIGGFGSGYPFFPPYQMTGTKRLPTPGMAGAQFPVDPMVDLRRNRPEDTSKVVTERIKQFRVDSNNLQTRISDPETIGSKDFWAAEFDVVSRALKSGAQLSFARLARRLQQSKVLTPDQEFEQVANEAKSLLSAGGSSQLSGVVARAKQGIERLSGFFKGIGDFVSPNYDDLSREPAKKIRRGIFAEGGPTFGKTFVSGQGEDRYKLGYSEGMLGIPDDLQDIPLGGGNKIKNAVESFYDKIVKSLGGFGGPGGPGGPRPPVGGGPGGGFYSDPGDLARRATEAAQQGPEALLGLKELAAPAKVSTKELEALSAILKEFRSVLDPTVEGFDQLNKRLRNTAGNIDRQLERRAPDADLLTRGFGPRAGRAVSEGLIGGAFPLLFGQGAGASVGGGLGGALGGFAGGGLGFGLSLIGTAAGTAFDTLGQKAIELGGALNDTTKTFDIVKERSLFSSRETEKYAEKLQEAGLVASASAVAQEEIIDAIGVDGVERLRNLETQSDKLNRAFSRLAIGIQEFVAGPMADFLERIGSAVNSRSETEQYAKLLERLPANRVEQLRARALGTVRKSGMENSLRRILPGTQNLEPDAGEIGRVSAIGLLSPILKEFSEFIPSSTRATPQQVKDEAVAQAKGQIDALNTQLEAIDIGKKLTDQVREAARQQEDLNQQAFDTRKQYEEAIGDIRLNIERTAQRESLDNVRAQNELYQVQGEIRLQQLSNASQALVSEQGANDYGRRLLEILGQAASLEVSTQQDIENKRRQFQLEMQSKEIDAEIFKSDIAKQVAKLGEDSQKRIAEINKGVRRSNEQYDLQRFKIEKTIAGLRLKQMEAEVSFAKTDANSQIKRARDENRPDMEQTIKYYQGLIRVYDDQAADIKNSKKAIDEVVAPSKLQEVGGFSTQGVSTAALDAVRERASAFAKTLLEANEGLVKLARAGQWQDIKDQFVELADQGYKSAVIELQDIVEAVASGGDAFAGAAVRLAEADKGITESLNSIGTESETSLVKEYRAGGLTDEAIRSLLELAGQTSLLAFAQANGAKTAKFYADSISTVQSQIESLTQEIEEATTFGSNYEQALRSLAERGLSPVSKEAEVLVNAAQRLDVLEEKAAVLQGIRTASEGLTGSLRGLIENFYELGSASKAVEAFGKEMSKKALGFVLDIAFKPVEENIRKSLIMVGKTIGFDFSTPAEKQLTELEKANVTITNIETALKALVDKIIFSQPAPAAAAAAPASQAAQAVSQPASMTTGAQAANNIVAGPAFQNYLKEIRSLQAPYIANELKQGNSREEVIARMDALKASLAGDIANISPDAGIRNEITKTVDNLIVTIAQKRIQEIGASAGQAGAGPSAALLTGSGAPGDPMPLPVDAFGASSGAAQQVKEELGIINEATAASAQSTAATAAAATSELRKSNANLAGAVPEWGKNLGGVVSGLSLAATGVVGILGGIQQIKEGSTSSVLSGIGGILTTIGGIGLSVAGMFKKPAANGATFSNGLAQFAKGGTFTNSVVSSPTLFKFANGGTTQMGEMGEAGPEAIMPLSRGRGGRLGVDASGLREAMGRPPGGATGSPVLNMSFQSTTFNGVEYVSRDQLEAAMAQTRRQAAKEGANRGMNMTLDKIQNSPSTRSRVGIR